MEVKSSTKFVRLSPQKARDVAREIQGLPVSSALDILNFTPKKAATSVKLGDKSSELEDLSANQKRREDRMQFPDSSPPHMNSR